MENPKSLLSEIVTKLKLIPGMADVLVEAYDTESEIYRNPDEARDNFSYGTGIMVFYEGGTFPRTGDTRGIRHDFSLLLKCRNDLSYFELLQRIYNGVPNDGMQMKFVDHELTGCDPFADFEHRQLTDGDRNVFWSLRFTAVEKC